MASLKKNSLYMFERVERAVKKFEAENFMVRQATEDADALIINTAISVSSAFDFVIVVGEDVDLLILLTALSTRSNIYILKPGKGKIS
jgi:molybdopterin biosynthesis enzyme